MIRARVREVPAVALIVVALVLLRLVAAAVTPLTFDEAYYWTWSKHLAGGYYDHPPMVAVIIRLGTLIAGDTELGVRLVAVLLGLPMSYAVYGAARILSGSSRVAASATILLNVTLMVSVGTLIVTPDAPLMVAAAFVLFTLAKVLDTGQGGWWLAVGLAVGAALLSKYTALLYGLSILVWLLAVPKLRKWLWSPWPYLGGIVAFAVFAPVILWNQHHQWVSFIKQLGRARVEGLTLRFVGEMIPTQFVFATPAVFILGAMGLYVLARRDGGAAPARRLVGALFWPITLYFVWHSLHARVEANWLGPVYPPFAVAAATAVHSPRWRGGTQRVVAFCRRWAAPGGVVLLLALVVQANTGLLTGYRRDTSVRSIGVGWPQLAAGIEAVRQRTGAACVLAPDYGTVSWLMFYLPKDSCVVQPSQRIRWVNAPEPDPALLAGKLLFVDEVRPNGQAALKAAYTHFEKVVELPRTRGPLTIETYEIDLLDGARGAVLDRSPPPELQSSRALARGP
ncbi:glycosyltransferase family 39 protein [Bradyrhizobium sp. U87765 SZCCT0131]|uniref:glycosyltransferase family 39 protein n=1 Tax=unclassified Bradyrhizobium TaxID=2631580 RepID=UPI001BAD37BA|nr:MULTISPECIES: glycosyltransferase family 39 protein [unclassified Bradyrhizobium]MBR1222885.1 glycosyltransferase family 39 protein [Bradyrhizobium sp. U87765 SZCCT0131]MBR1262621.1 glycosyltransferase family 39 protein [Bradyrhizobium sp. U87765 SZCCT0134]MBR1308907.1 glycosyltransferase family 39 protein [Bradyrhizobium sp. U87765 SZCCT0110]MBR1318403.1 glycosyltransferase family 39 protein [Bradyrhizobium sp. U87765 SZCCT0109]MBR1352107.1 glycosyltransferase family 39 protein [Bradyrhizo